MIYEQDRANAVYNAIEARAKRPGVYVSPFEAFKQRFPQIKWQEMKGIVAYHGTVASVINDLEEALIDPDQDRDFFSIALDPPRLIRAVIDWKIDHPFDEVEELVGQAVETGLSVYVGNPNALELLQALRDRTELEHPQLLTSIVEQKDDLPTWIGTDPERSYETARRLAYKFNGDDILLIALGHGGTATGMDVFLRYRDITQSDSTFYVTRFSRLKKKDQEPQLTVPEVTQLSDVAQGRKIVVFEEDSVSGRTMDGAISYFRSRLFNGSPIAQDNNLRVGSTSPAESNGLHDLNHILLMPAATNDNKPIIHSPDYNSPM